MTGRTPLQERILNSKNTIYDAMQYGRDHNMPIGTAEEIKNAENAMIANSGIPFNRIPGKEGR